MAINSKAKGARVERICAKALQTLTGREFARVGVSSGARKGMPSRGAEEAFAGDLVTPEGWRWSVECKGGYDLTAASIIRWIDTCGKFWAQAVADAERIQKEPMLIIRLDGGMMVILVGEDDREAWREVVNQEAQMESTIRANGIRLAAYWYDI